MKSLLNIAFKHFINTASGDLYKSMAHNSTAIFILIVAVLIASYLLVLSGMSLHENIQ